MSSEANKRLAIRQALVAMIAESASIGLPLETLEMGVRAAGFPMSREALSAQLNYLQTKGLVAEHRSELSAAAVRWKVTAEGIEYCEREGLI